MTTKKKRGEELSPERVCAVLCVIINDEREF
jgi:hypothetical protein